MKFKTALNLQVDYEDSPLQLIFNDDFSDDSRFRSHYIVVTDVYQELFADGFWDQGAKRPVGFVDIFDYDSANLTIEDSKLANIELGIQRDGETGYVNSNDLYLLLVADDCIRYELDGQLVCAGNNCGDTSRCDSIKEGITVRDETGEQNFILYLRFQLQEPTEEVKEDLLIRPSIGLVSNFQFAPDRVEPDEPAPETNSAIVLGYDPTIIYKEPCEPQLSSSDGRGMIYLYGNYLERELSCDELDFFGNGALCESIIDITNRQDLSSQMFTRFCPENKSYGIDEQGDIYIPSAAGWDWQESKWFDNWIELFLIVEGSKIRFYVIERYSWGTYYNIPKRGEVTLTDEEAAHFQNGSLGLRIKDEVNVEVDFFKIYRNNSKGLTDSEMSEIITKLVNENK
ncbi:MAG: hypothetical protein ACN4E2_01090 [Nitrospinota bacterium]